MSWADTTLSTGLTIKRFEREITELSKRLLGSGVAKTANTSTTTITVSTSGLYAGDILINSVTEEFVTVQSVGSGTVVVDAPVNWYNEDAGYSYYVQSWQDKITLAKTFLGVDLENALTTGGYSVNELDGEVLLDLIANPSIFNQSSDFLTLYLIYSDLTLGGTVNEIFTHKAEFYKAAYDKDLASNLKRINFDTDFDGTAETYRQDVSATGRLTR